MHDLKLGPIETRFAHIVWEHAPLTTARLVELCGAELQWKRTTTYTVLKKLSEKGLFRTENSTVTVLMSREEFEAAQSAAFVEETFRGSLPAFVAAFTRKKEISPQELRELRELLDRYGEG